MKPARSGERAQRLTQSFTNPEQGGRIAIAVDGGHDLRTFEGEELLPYFAHPRNALVHDSDLWRKYSSAVECHYHGRTATGFSITKSVKSAIRRAGSGAPVLQSANG